MRLISLFLVLLVLCLGPGWAQEIPLPSSGEEPAAELYASVDHQAESPAWTVRLEPPDRSLLDARALVHAPQAVPNAGPTARGERPPLAGSASPSLHLRLCVFLC